MTYPNPLKVWAGPCPAAKGFVLALLVALATLRVGAQTTGQGHATADTLQQDAERVAFVAPKVDPAIILRAEDALEQHKPIPLTTPYNVMYAHLHYTGVGGNLDSAAACFVSRNLTREELYALARQLKQVLDGKGIWVDLDPVPHDPAYTDSATGLHRYAPFAQFKDIYLEKGRDGQWRYSARAEARIEQLHAEVFPFGVGEILEDLPGWSLRKILGLAVWQYLGLLVLILLGLLLHRLIAILLHRVVVRLLARGFQRLGLRQFTRSQILPRVRPLSTFLVLLLVWQFIPALQLPIALGMYVRIAFLMLVPLYVIIFGYRLVDLFADYLELRADKSKSKQDDQIVPLIRTVLRILVVTVGVLFILSSYGVDITALLAGLSIGGLALALAAQDTVKNLLASIIIFIDRPFQVGDWIAWGGKEGTVEEVGLRATRVRTFYNSVIYAPNAQLFDASVDNMGLRVFRRYMTHLGLMYGTPPDRIDAFVEGLREIVRTHPYIRKDVYEIHFQNFSPHSLDVLVYIFFTVESWTHELACRHDFNIAAIKLADTLGVQFAFPTQTLHIETMPGQQSLSPRYEPGTYDAELKQHTLAFVQQLKHRQSVEDWEQFRAR